FLYQAEDGIRGKLVTGVQTCALPILRAVGGGADDGGQRGCRQTHRAARRTAFAAGVGHEVRGAIARAARVGGGDSSNARAGTERSEERRVGKERRGRGARQQ